VTEYRAHGRGGEERDKRNTARIHEHWEAVERGLSWYAQRSLARQLRFSGRVGWYLLGAGIVFTILTILVGSGWIHSSGARWTVAAVGIAYIIDAALVNTSIVFVTRDPIHRLRSTLLALLNLFNIAIVFGLFYALERNCFSRELSALDALYYSFVTITTVGFGDISPKRECWLGQLTVIAELVVGFYFIAAVLSVVVSWAQRPSDESRFGGKGKR
jgi:hypothetical protein